MKKNIIIAILIFFISQISTLNAITLFDPKRGIEAVEAVKVVKKKQLKAKVVPLYMKLLGITKINNNVQFKLFDLQIRKKKTINWNTDMRNQVILKDFYKIDRIEYGSRSIILKPKIEVKCQGKKELNLSCNDKNEFVLTLMRNKAIPGKAQRATPEIDRLNGGKAVINPFARAIKKK
ncbi:MAG: hypothetical protein QM479_05795 [Pseudomonadota bacterium]